MKTALKITLIFVFFNAFYLRAELLLGLHAHGDHLAYAYKKTLFIRSISKDSIEKEMVLVKDTSICRLLYTSLLQTKQILKADGPEIKQSIADFSIVNLTYCQAHLYVGIRFFKSLKAPSKVFYGLLEFDMKMNLSNYFIFNRLKDIHLTLLPYFPLEFRDSQTLVLPTLEAGKMLVKNYTLNKLNHVIETGSLYKKDVQFSKYNQVKHPESIVLDPMLYSVQRSAYEYYFQFPFPVIIQSKEKHLDVRHDFEKLKLERNPGIGSGMTLLFDQQIKLDSAVLLASYQKGEQIYFLYSELALKKAQLIRYNFVENQYSPLTWNIDYKNTYFTFHQGRLLALTFLEGNVVVKSIFID